MSSAASCSKQGHPRGRIRALSYLKTSVNAEYFNSTHCQGSILACRMSDRRFIPPEWHILNTAPINSKYHLLLTLSAAGAQATSNPARDGKVESEELGKEQQRAKTNRLGEAARGLGTGQDAETLARNHRKKDTREQECTNTQWAKLMQRNIGTDGKGDKEKIRENTEIYPCYLKSLPKSLGIHRIEKRN